MNIQPIEKLERSDGKTLDVHSVFHTIQGEGPLTGRAAIFIRLAGCNLQCPLCDTAYTQGRARASVESIMQTVGEMPPTNLIVLTGGEPFRQNIHPLVHTLLEAGHTVQVETNGTLPPPTDEFAELCSLNILQRNKCFIVCSPKAAKVNKLLQPLICAYKYVVSYDSVLPNDGLPIQALQHSVAGHIARPPAGYTGPIYVQPCDNKDEHINALNLRAAMASTQLFDYTLQLQIHKILNLE